MEKRGFKWQIFFGTMLLAGVIGCLFLPRMRITGDRYLSMVMEVNRMAERENIEVARSAGTADIIDTYERGTSKREEKAFQYQKEIDKALSRRNQYITGAELIIWCFTSDGSVTFRGIEYNPVYQIEWSHLEEIFWVMGILLLIPSILAVLTIMIMMIRRKTQRFLIFVTGIVTVGANIVWLEILPQIIWERASENIVAYDMISEQILQIDGVGEYSIRMILQQFAAQGYYMNFVVGGLLIIVALLFWTVWRPYSKEEIQEEQFINAAHEADNVEQWEIFATNPLPEKQIQIREPGKVVLKPINEEEAAFPMRMEVKGYLHGVRGQYAGFDFEIEPGEEIILGRDPEFCDVRFKAPYISRRHCGIRYDELTGYYQIIDYSVSGTTLSNGKTVSAGSYMLVHPGTIVYLGGEEEAIRLG